MTPPNDNKQNPNPKLPLYPRSMGRRGGALALGLWGASMLASPAQAQADDLTPIQTAEDPIPVVPAYGRPPMPEPMYGLPPEPEPNPDPYPHAVQGNWALGTSGDTLSVIGHTYTVTAGGKVQETGQANNVNILERARVDGSFEIGLALSGRQIGGKPAPDTTETWLLSADGMTLTRGTIVYTRLVVDTMPVAEYGIAPIPE